MDTEPCVRRRCWRLRPSASSAGRRCRTLGRNVRLVVESADVRSPEVRFDHWRFRVTVPMTLGEDERYEPIRRAVVRWYRSRADRAAAQCCGALVAKAWTRGNVTGTRSGPKATLGKLRA